MTIFTTYYLWPQQTNEPELSGQLSLGGVTGWKYRSAYKNARRLTVTETNMAYRMADHTRWNQLGFVKGFRVVLSHEHPMLDICDTLQGEYPKGFIFTGWHPQCLCHAVAITMNMDEFGKYQEAILDGTEEEFLKGVKGVENMPEGFTKWIGDNAEKVKGYKSLPFFIKDNQDNIPIIKYNMYGNNWDKTFFNKSNGGFVVTEKGRIAHGNLNKNEAEKYKKEADMCLVFAQNGYQIEHLNEVSGHRSPDVTINGVLADLKRTGSHNNIIKYAKYAINNQGAKMVLFQFDKMNADIIEALKKIEDLGIKGKYFITGFENEIVNF